MTDLLPPITARTVIEAFLPADGPVSLDVVFTTANAVGIGDQPLRLTLHRMVAAADIIQTGRGRKGEIGLTTTGRRRLARDRSAFQLALAQDQGLAPWDGRWRMVALSTTETDRPVRDAVRRQLLDAGAVTVSTGLYLSPHDLTGMLDAAEHKHLVQATATEVDVRGVTDPHALTELLWPQVEIVEAYAIVDHTIEQIQHEPHAGARSGLVGQLRLAEALEQAMRTDPLIPPELRAGSWPPTQTRKHWINTWSALTNKASPEGIYQGWMPPHP